VKRILVVLWIAVLAATFTLPGCLTTSEAKEESNAAGEIAGEAGETAKDAAKENINKEVREGVNDAFKRIFGD
jgi:hypothetical protein